jgi:DNA-directed RNA polymerase subunit RPC12/RpoP
MITFQCPACHKVLKVQDDSAGKKAPCPKCGQRLLVPPPVQNKTVLGQPVPESAPEPIIPAGKIAVGCPGCGRSILLPPNEVTWQIECSQCRTRFVPVGTPSPPPVAPPFRSDGGFRATASGPPIHDDVEEDLSRPSIVITPKHSGLGIASFVILMLVGGMDAVLAAYMALNFADQHRAWRELAPQQDRATLTAVQVKLNGLEMFCMNCVSIPVCLVGVGLALAALVAHSRSNNMLAYIGLAGNCSILLGNLILYLFLKRSWP